MQVYYLCLLLTVSALAQTLHVDAKSCGQRLDLMFAVDTTSSLTSNDFATMRDEVKKIASTFIVKPRLTRMALISIAKTARVVADFDAVKSLIDFNNFVDSLSFSTDTADLSEGIKVATNSLVVKARKADVPLILIMVKDRRSAGSSAYDSSMLSRMTSEAQAIKNQGATINTVGIGGLWITKETEAIYGSDYLLFKDKNKAIKSIKSLSKAAVCKVDCSTKSSSEQGLCFGSRRLVFTDRVSLVRTTANVEVCRNEIVRDFQSCSDDNGQRCNEFIGDRNVGGCRADNKLTVSVTIRNFQAKLQKCDATTISNDIVCGDVDKCPGQKADIIIVVDRSGSIGDVNFPLVLGASADLVRYLNIGPNNVKVGVVSFGLNVYTEIALGSDDDKNSVINKILGMQRNLEGYTYTHLGLKRAGEQFNQLGRQGVSKYAFLITDGESSNQLFTLSETQRLKDTNVVLYCIGVHKPDIGELSAMTAPETKERMIIRSTFPELKTWSEEFSKKMCHQTAPPNAKLCDDNVFVQSVSKCESGKQFVTNIGFAFDASKNCLKSTQTKTMTNCKSKCISPTDGNEYTDGSTWNSLCYEFKCQGTTPTVLSSKCLAADGTCKDVGSAPFKCLDRASNQVDNCQCVSNGSGTASVVIDKE